MGLRALSLNFEIMDQDIIIEKLLNGVPLNDFISFYIAALVGFILFFGWDVKEGIKNSKTTPNKWDWPSFWKGWKRITKSLILIAAGIIFWPQISTFLFASDSTIGLELWTAFGLGMMLDKLNTGLTTFISTKK